MLKTANPRTEKKIMDKANNAGTNNFLLSSFEVISSYIMRKAIKIRVPMNVLDPMIKPVEEAIVEDAIVEEAIAEDAIDDIMLDSIFILSSRTWGFSYVTASFSLRNF